MYQLPQTKNDNLIPLQQIKCSFVGEVAGYFIICFEAYLETNQLEIDVRFQSDYYEIDSNHFVDEQGFINWKLD